MANMVIGNSVTLLNDQGFHFKVFPPEVHMDETGLAGSADTEALVICIETPCGNIHLNIAMHYFHRRRHERNAIPARDEGVSQKQTRMFDQRVPPDRELPP